jgi:hypothetical protein
VTGNGFDIVTMPPALRARVAALFAAIDTKMDQASQLQGAKELAAAYEGARM